MNLRTMTRWEPFGDLITLQDRVSRLFGDSLGHMPVVEGVGAWLPPVDIHEESDRLIFTVEIPGVSREDIDIKVENGALILRGEKKQETSTESDSAHRIERFYGTFTRSFSLPGSINTEKIAATYKNGVLQIVLPKSEEAKPKTIKVLSA